MLQLIHDLFENLYNLEALIRWGGMGALIAIVFAETGLLIGFFLPGDSLLVVAGLFAARGDLDIWWLNLSLMAAAIAGDAVGYHIGLKAGMRLFTREDSLFFRRSHLYRTHAFYQRHGGKTIILARFMPIIRTFAPVVAGIGTMGYRRFAAYNVIGGVSWVASMTLLGYFLGARVPNIDRNIHYVVAIVIFLSILPGIIAFLRERLRAAPPPAPGAGGEPGR